MDELQIIKILSRRIDDKRFPYQAPRVFIYNWESDYWAMTSTGMTYEFEIKISRADYFADAKKDKHQRENDGANYFYYVCPKGLIKKDEIDKRYGLMYVWDTGYVEVVKKPRQINKNSFTNWKLLADKFYWKYRTLWKEKYIDKVITHDQYIDGLLLDLSEEIDNTSTT